MHIQKQKNVNVVPPGVRGSNLYLAPTQRGCTNNASSSVHTNVVSTSTAAVVLPTISFRFLSRSLTTASYKTVNNTSTDYLLAVFILH
jgi:hypothetical protein